MAWGIVTRGGGEGVIISVMAVEGGIGIDGWQLLRDHVLVEMDNRKYANTQKIVKTPSPSQAITHTTD